MTNPSPRISRRTVLSTAGLAGLGLAVRPGSLAAKAIRRPLTAAPDSPALVVHGGSLWTGVGSGPVAGSGIAIGRDGMIAAVGSDDDLLALVGRDTEVIDAAGGTVMPGLLDMHSHPLSAAEASLNFTLEDADLTTDELIEILQGFLDSSSAQEPDGWLVVESWNPTGPSDNVPHKRFLDSLDTGRPILLSGSDGHNSWVNSRALQLADITASTPQPAGGEIVMDGDGPTGLLKESAQDAIRQLVPEVTDEQLRGAEADVFALLAANGITSFLDAAGSATELATYGRHAAAGTMLQRALVNFHLGDELLLDPAAAVEAANAARGDAAGPWLAMPSVKVFIDGVLEFPAQTASLLKPYLSTDGKPADYTGEQYLDSEQMAALCVALDAAGWQVHTHAIGDAGVRSALDGYEAAYTANPSADLRHTIAHLQLVDPADYPRFAANAVIACMQLQWAVRDEYTVDAVEEHIGPERMSTMYPAGAIEKAGGIVSGGSDWPVDALNPWNQIRTAIDRIGEFSTYGDPLGPEQALSPESALQMHTVRSAFQGHLDAVTGSLAVGKAADVVVLDRDLHAVPVAEISSAVPRYTFIGGKAAYDESSSAGPASTNGVRRAVARPAALHAGFRNPAALRNPAGRHQHCCQKP